MITPRLRPRLRMQVPLSPVEVVHRLDAHLKCSETACTGLARDGLIDLRIPERDHHFWSPQLTVIVKESEEGSELTGHFGPNANLWTMFLACYGFVVCCAIFGGFYGVSQLMIERSPWALWSLPIAAVLVVLIYVAAGIGQRLGRDQVEVLLHFLEEAVAADGQRSARAAP